MKKKKTHKQKKKEEQKIKIYDMKTQTKETEVKTALKEMTSLSIIINMLLNGVSYTHTLIDSECLCFGMVTKKTVKQNKLKWFSVPP